MVSTGAGELDVDAPGRWRSLRSSCLAPVGSLCAGRGFVFCGLAPSHSVALAVSSGGIGLNSWLQGLSNHPPLETGRKSALREPDCGFKPGFERFRAVGRVVVSWCYGGRPVHSKNA